MHERVAIIKAIGNQASRDEINTLIQACLRALGAEAIGELKQDAI